MNMNMNMNERTYNFDNNGITDFINTECKTNETNWRLYSETERSGDFFVSDGGLVCNWRYAELVYLVTPTPDTKDNYLHTKGKLRGRNSPTIHQVVWDTFGDRAVPEGYVIDHIDENKRNNHISNLQLLTRGENVSKSLSGGARAGIRNPNSRAYQAEKAARLQRKLSS